MGNYNKQYRSYYQELKAKSLGKEQSPIYRSSLSTDIYGNVNFKQSKKDFFSSMTNVFIYQLVVVIFMLMSAFYLKYSPSRQESYHNVKAVINDDTYSIVDEEVGSFNISEVLNKINSYIKESLNGGKVEF